MSKGINDLLKMAKSHKIEIKGVNNMPEIGISPIEYINPFSENEEILVAEKKYMTCAKLRDGRICDLNAVSDQYKLVQHYEAIHNGLEAILEKAPQFGKPLVNLNFSSNGGIMYANMVFPELVEIVKDDPIKPRVVLTNSADLKKRFTLTFGAFRLVCSNGMVIPDSRFPNCTMIRKLHRNGSLNLDECLSEMVVGFDHFSDTFNLWKEYDKIEISKQEYIDILEKTGISERAAEKVLEENIRGNDTTLSREFAGDKKVSGWLAYNAATQYFTDNSVNEGTGLERNRRLATMFDNMVA